MKKLLILLFAAVIGLNAYAQNLSDAKKAIEAEQYEKAKGILETLVKNNPTDGQYNYFLGSLYLIMSEDALAKQAFDKGVTTEKNGHLNYIGQGEMLLNAGNPDEAAALFEKATAKIRKKDTEELIGVAKAYLHSFNPDYAKAAEYAKRAVANVPNSAEGFLVLGDAEYNQDNLNEAYIAYSNAFDFDNSLLRAKLHIAVITKKTRAFAEAVESLEEINKMNPSYGPAYRELAEVYYLWATEKPDHYREYIDKALKYYEQYMQLTDYSLDSRMRHADFLVLAKDYQSLQKEAAEMQKLDKVNLRILRYLGYSAFENGNYKEASDALTKFISSVEPHRILGMDYTYLAKADAKRVITGTVRLTDKNTGRVRDSLIVDTERMRQMNSTLLKAIEKEVVVDKEFNELALQLYRGREFRNAAEVFGTIAQSTTGKADQRLYDQIYYANSVLFGAFYMDSVAKIAYLPEMHKADSVFALVIEGSPSTQDSYFNRARLNRMIPGEEAKVAALFEEYIKVISEKGEGEMAKAKMKLAEAYTSIGVFYVDLDKPRAIAAFEKALTYDPNDGHAKSALEFLKTHK